MSETPTPTTPPESTDNKHCHRNGKRGGMRRIFKGAFFVAALVGIPWAVAHAAGGGGFCHRGHDAPQSAEELRERLDKGASRLGNRLDTSAEQSTQIDAVLDRVAPELFALKDDKDALHQDFRAALTSPTVDAAELESLRVEGLALADTASRIVVKSVADVAKVLTPEQRHELADLAARFHGE